MLSPRNDKVRNLKLKITRLHFLNKLAHFILCKKLTNIKQNTLAYTWFCHLSSNGGFILEIAILGNLAFGRGSIKQHVDDLGLTL